jgi:hypothetical protein
MQPFCAKAESDSRFQRWRLFLGDLVPRASPQAHNEMRLWRNTIQKRLSNRGRCEGLEAGTPNGQLTGDTSLKYSIPKYNNLRSTCADCLDFLFSRL